MVSKLPIIWKQTVLAVPGEALAAGTAWTVTRAVAAAMTGARGRYQFCEGCRQHQVRFDRSEPPAATCQAAVARGHEIRVRLHIIRNEILENVGKSQSCMFSELRIICKQTVGSWRLTSSSPKWRSYRRRRCACSLRGSTPHMIS